MIEDDDKRTIKNKIEPKWKNVIFIGLWLTILIGIFLFLSINLILDSNRSQKVGVLFGFIPFLLFGIKFIQILLWNARGVEQITINNKELRIERLGTFMLTPKTFNLLDLTEIGLTDNEPYSLFHRYSWNTEEGKVIFKYLGTSKQFGIELGKKDATDIATLLKEKSDLAKKENGII